MAQNSKSENNIDADCIIIKPSLQRVRNILTLEERIAAIKAYDERPMYTKVARMFNCSWEQIKNIITNRDAIMEFYEATAKQQKKKIEICPQEEMDLRKRKIQFLGECLYEYLQRAQYHAKLTITEELIRVKALEFQDYLKVEDFTPNKQWINLFRSTYNISLANKKISTMRIPPDSMDLKDIMTFCTRLTKTNSNLLSRYNSFDDNNVECESKRLRKLKFLEKGLSEYYQRIKSHHQKSIKLDDLSLRQVALEFNEILKVQDFDPTIEWIRKFKIEQDKKTNSNNIKKLPCGLDLKDILSYCSRMEAKTTPITLAPKETALQMRVMPKFPNKPETELNFQKNSIIYLEENEQKYVKPVSEKQHRERSNLEQPPPLKIRKIESINNDPELQRKFQNSRLEQKTSNTICIQKVIKEPVENPFYINKIMAGSTKSKEQQIVYVRQETVPKDHELLCLKQEQQNIQIKEEEKAEDIYILPTNTLSSPPPTYHQHHRVKQQQQQSNHLHLRPADDGEEELPRDVNSIRDVLLLLKPLEEYAMLKENYRAIGLITQLEEVLKNQPEETNTEEEFIG